MVRLNKAAARPLQNRAGNSTVEAVLILSALVVAAFVFRDGLTLFTDRLTEAAGRPEGAPFRLTFGGVVRIEVSGGGSASGGILDWMLDSAVEGPLKLLFPASRAVPAVLNAANTQENRGPEALDAVLNALDVTRTSRYQPTLSATFCNIFAWDATTALGAEIPHWVDRVTGEAYRYDTALSYSENAERGRELNANALYDWLETRGTTVGYRAVDRETATLAANAGRPAVAIWQNPDTDRSGHIVVLRPYDPAYPGDSAGTYVAQAGLRNSNYMTLEKAFGSKLNTVRYYIHD